MNPENKENDQKVSEIAEQISADIQAGKKPTIVNKFLKNFFFSALRAKDDIKAIEKEIGKLESVSLIMVKGKSILRAQSKKGREDIPMKDEEVVQICKNFKVKQESIDACKSIFVQLNFTTKVISIQQNKLDGTQSILHI